MPGSIGERANAADVQPVHVYIVILNWNGWRDTIECLESAFQLRSPKYTLVVCDNASSDGSLDNLERWAQGAAPATATPFLPVEPVHKPLRYERLSRSEAERGAGSGAALVLIDNGANLGFGGGCNVGIRYALARGDCSHVWLLNNDSVVPPDALQPMVDLCAARPRVGLCGSQVRYYTAPAMVQTFGGTLNRWLCTTHSLACGAPADTISVEPRHIDYVPGASMLITRAFLDQVGLLYEDYFLYFEEIDWAERGRSRRFELAVCADSIVYHRGGASIGSPTEAGERGVRSEYFLLHSRLMFARRFYRGRLLTVYLGMLGSLLNRVRRRQWRRAWIALGVLMGVRPSIVKLPT